MKEYKPLEGVVQSEHETERNDEMVGCASIVVATCCLASIIFTSFVVYRILIGGVE